MREHPQLLSESFSQSIPLPRLPPRPLELSLFTLECMNTPNRPGPHSSPASLTFREASTASSTRSIASESAANLVSDYIPSEWEKKTYYHGVSVDPPELLYRSDYLHNPFLRPTGRIQHTPTKTAHGVFGTHLNVVWHTVAPKIRDMLKERQIRYSAIHAARFTTHGEDEGALLALCPTHPTGTTAEDAHLASPDILALLSANGVHGAVVEWFEAALERLSRPALLRVTPDTNPASYVRRFLTPALGMPIATAERENYDAQGTVAFFFHENKDKRGKPSSRVLAVTNCHVLRKDTTVPYEFKGAAGAPPQRVRLAGFRRFQRGLDEITGAIDRLNERAYRVKSDITGGTRVA